MSKSLNLTISVAVICFLAGCAAEKTVVEKPLAAVETANSHLGRMCNVRTTAYTRKEEGGIRNALGTYLSGRHVMSAAADWSRFPLGTRFRICSTREEFIIDDYGTALVGTNTIDLYKPTKLEMKRWGVRNVDIDVLQWGSEEKSLEVLGPRAKHPQVQSMLVALQKKTPSTPVAVASSAKESSKKSDKKVASKKQSSPKSEKKVASKKESSTKSDKKVASSKKESSEKSDKRVASDTKGPSKESEKKESSKKSDKKVASRDKESSKKSDKKVTSVKKESSMKSDEKVASSAKKSSTKSGKKVAANSNQSSAKPAASKQASKSPASRTLD